MRPAHAFRLWLRRAPTGERIAVGTALVVVLALIALFTAGATSDDRERTIAAAVAPESDAPYGGAPPSTALMAPAEGGGAAGLTVGPPIAADASEAAPQQPPAAAAATDTGEAASASTAAAAACPSAPAGVRGVTATEIRIAITLVNVAGAAANELFGIAPPDEQRKAYNAVIASINASSGVACRKIVARYFEANPADQTNLQRVCLDAVSAGVFAVVDTGAYALYPQKVCYAQHQTPYFSAFFLTDREARTHYPYLFGFNTLDRLYRDTALGLRDRGFFTAANGFEKLGFGYHSCAPDVVDVMRRSLREAGVPDARIVTYDFGCPSTFASPGDIQAAILKFRQNGVTHMTAVRMFGDMMNFTRTAQQQGFKPKYGLPDESLVNISYGNQRPDPDNMAGAVAITGSRNGEERTPGSTPTAGTAKCNAIIRAAGFGTVYEEPPVIGNACSGMWMFAAAAGNAPTLEQTALAAGLQRAKSVDFSFPQGPNDLAADRNTTAGQFWRAVQFHRACSCWQLLERDFRPSYR